MAKDNKPQTNSEDAPSLFWRLLGIKAAKEGIEIGKPEKNAMVVPFVPGIMLFFFKGWFEQKEENSIHPTFDDK